MAAFVLALLVAMLVNLLTALFSRKHAISLLPWLFFSVAVYGAYVGLTTDVAWRQAMEIAKRFPQWLSYPIVILIAAILAGVYWRAVNIAVDKLDRLTTTSGAEPQPPLLDKTPAPPLKHAAPIAANAERQVEHEGKDVVRRKTIQPKIDAINTTQDRPYFVIKGPGIRPLANSPPFRLIIPFENTGEHPARGLTAILVMVPRTLSGDPTILRMAPVANDIPKGEPTPWYFDSVVLPREVPPMFAFLRVTY